MIKISAGEIGVLVTSQAKLGPVCEELARFDLSSFVAEGERRVTLRQLAERWGWRKDRVRRFLDRVDEVEMISGRGSAGSILRAARHGRDKGETRARQSNPRRERTSRRPRDMDATRARRERDTDREIRQAKPSNEGAYGIPRDKTGAKPPSPSPPSPKGDGSPPLSPPDRRRRIGRDEMRQVAEAWRAAAGREPSRPISRRLRQLQAGYVGTLNGSGVATLERDIGEAFRHFAGKPPRYVLACLEGRVDQGDFGKPWRRHTSTGHTIQRAAGRRSFAEISE